MGWTFWLRRYGPAEVACLVCMLAASRAAVRVTDSPPLLAASAILGATVGFYGVLVAGIVREQRTALGDASATRVVARTALLLVAEFGAAEVLDTLLWRPALMTVGVVLVGEGGHAVWGLLAGKVASDVLFYVVSALSYRGTLISGLRAARRTPLSHM